MRENETPGSSGRALGFFGGSYRNTSPVEGSRNSRTVRSCYYCTNLSDRRHNGVPVCTEHAPRERKTDPAPPPGEADNAFLERLMKGMFSI